MSHLNKVMLVGLVILITAFGMDQWWGNVFIILYMYYFIFVANIFRKQYTKENAITKVFFESNETPLVVAGVMIVVFILIIMKLYPDENLNGAYINAFVGGATTTFARFKRGKVSPR